MPAIGVDTVTSISERYVFPYVVDEVYLTNAILFRLMQANRVIIQGGFQLELSFIWQKASGTGPYQGYDLLDVTPDDTVINAVWNWKQYGKTVVIDGLTEIRADHPDAVANIVRFKLAEAEQWMEDRLGTGLYTDTITNLKELDGLQGAVDDGTIAGTYAGINRTTYPLWKSNLDAATTTLSLSKLRTLFGQCTVGGRHPTIITSQQANYDRYWNLVQPIQRFPAGGTDEQLAKAGFSNLLFDGCPWIVDAHVPNSNLIYLLNETYLQMPVARRTNARWGFKLTDFQVPTNQDAMVAKLLFAGNLICENPGRQGKMTAIAA